MNTYYQENRYMLANLHSGNYYEAMKGLKKNDFLKKKQNKLLLLLEKGKLEHEAARFTESNICLNEADQMLDVWSDSKVRSLSGSDEGLNFGFLKALYAKLMGSTLVFSYRTEDYEKVMLHYYKALNYINLDSIDEAVVEARQLDLLNQRLSDKKFAEPGYSYVQQAFPHLLMGILYEYRGDDDNALIAYENAFTLYSSPVHKQLYGSDVPSQLKWDILNTANRIGAKDKLDYYSKMWNLKYSAPAHSGEVILFYEKGFVPHKDEVVIERQTTYTRTVRQKTTVVPATLVYKVPRFVVSPAECNVVIITLDKEAVNPENIYDPGFYMSKIINHRFEVEGNALLTSSFASHEGMNNENRNADTRHWQSLPSSIAYARIPVSIMNHEMRMYCGSDPSHRTILDHKHRLLIRRLRR